MQSEKNSNTGKQLSLREIPKTRRHFYVFVLLALVAIVGNRGIKGDVSPANDSTDPSGKSHMANVADNTRLAYH
jgi:hypothetical protein